jgi:hypothetical protein
MGDDRAVRWPRGHSGRMTIEPVNLDADEHLHDEHLHDESVGVLSIPPVLTPAPGDADVFGYVVVDGQLFQRGH